MTVKTKVPTLHRSPFLSAMYNVKGIRGYTHTHLHRRIESSATLIPVAWRRECRTIAPPGNPILARNPPAALRPHNSAPTPPIDQPPDEHWRRFHCLSFPAPFVAPQKLTNGSRWLGSDADHPRRTVYSTCEGKIRNDAGLKGTQFMAY